MMGAILMVSAVVLIVFVLFAVWSCVCNCFLFTKFGEPAWKGIIPFYNTYVMMYYIWDTKFFWVYLVTTIGTYVTSSMDTAVLYSCFLIAELVFSAMMYYHLSLAFGYGFGFAAGLLLLNIIFLPILAFGRNSQYLGNPYYSDYSRYDSQGYNRRRESRFDDYDRRGESRYDDYNRRRDSQSYDAYGRRYDDIEK